MSDNKAKEIGFHAEFKRDWHRLRGVPEGASPPPPREWSTSQGDMSKNSFRPSDLEGLFTVAISDDNGQPITGETNDLLIEVLLELRAIRAALEKASV